MRAARRKRTGDAYSGNLARLGEQADGLRTELDRLRGDLDVLRHGSSHDRSERALDTNEQLLIAALHAQNIAVEALSDLREFAWWSERDVLTQIPNRALTVDRLENAIAMARRHGTRIAVLFIDLDHFKKINDDWGYAVGDAALQLVARRLLLLVRDSDTVSRHAGDQFLILLPEIVQSADVSAIAAKMLSAIATPSRVCDHVLRLTASLGISIFPDDAADAAGLIARADAAMHVSKRRR
jgi:diguanylate cyclase (GGDEF)-like protein